MQCPREFTERHIISCEFITKQKKNVDSLLWGCPQDISTITFYEELFNNVQCKLTYPSNFLISTFSPVVMATQERSNSHVVRIVFSHGTAHTGFTKHSTENIFTSQLCL